MSKKIKINSKMLEAWNKHNPKIGWDESLIRVAKVGKYGNYELKNRLMELITFLKNKYNVCVIKKDDQKYFKQLEQEIIKLAIDMVILL